MAGVGDKVFGGKLLSKSMTGRIVLSHVHVSTLRRTRSTEKLRRNYHAGINLKFFNCYKRRT